MGLDMYLDRVRKVGNASIRDMINIQEYLDYESEDHKSYTLKEWCGVDEDSIDMNLVEKSRPYFIDKYYYWDTEKKHASKSIFDHVGYWRKANQIHKWFVDNVQNGVDDCGIYEVSEDQLKELLLICNTIANSCSLEDGKVKNGKSIVDGKWKTNYEDGKTMTNAKIAEKLLPTSSGFFFGCTDYDEWYMDDIHSTIDIINNVLKTTDFDIEVVTYSSSW